jgi:rRNA maturation endonuclease Nob1
MPCIQCKSLCSPYDICPMCSTQLVQDAIRRASHGKYYWNKE